MDNQPCVEPANQMESQLQLSQFAMENAFIEIYWLDSHARICYANKQACEITGYSKDEFLHLTLADLDPNFPIDQWESHWASLKLNPTQSFETLHRRKNGELFPVEVVANYVCFEGHEYNVGYAKDISERKLTEERLKISNQRFEALLQAVPDLMFEITKDGYYLNVWGGRNDMLAAPQHQLIGRCVKETLPEAAAQEVMLSLAEADLTGHSSGRQIKLLLPQGECWFELSVAKQSNDNIKDPAFIVLSRDITARKLAEEEIRNLAFYDALTGLPNRRLLMDRLRLALSLSVRNNYYGAVLFLDLDRFKILNDTLGHDYGDLLLLEVAARIQHCVRETDTVARLGGDEFVVLLEEIDEHAEHTSQKVALIAEKIRESLSTPFSLNGNEYQSTPSIGVCLYSGNEVSVDTLLKHADMAMYQVKGSGRNGVRFFDPAMQQIVETRSALEADLRHAVPGGQLHLYYQLQVDENLQALGAEALVRWIHPVKGMISPMQFIPIAEESTLILDIGGWVLDTACAQLALWSANAQTRLLTLAVNVSAQQFKQPGFVEHITDLLLAYHVDPARLKLELTESVVLSDMNDVVAKMHALKILGVSLSMDDFGTGYSSLSYLKKLPLDQIKIDQSFVRDMTIDQNDQVMVQAIIGMTKNFGLNVIAEGVETEAQLNLLKHMGCLVYQGYLFSKPVPVEQFLKLLPHEQFN
jgi:diguanylate cyclase (GGDEF)-like protein/PAS domain S-box-containing protein